MPEAIYYLVYRRRLDVEGVPVLLFELHDIIASAEVITRKVEHRGAWPRARSARLGGITLTKL